jgi:putative ABC transport system permease protein
MSLGLSHILLSMAFVGGCGGVSIFLGLKAERKIAIAVFRSVLQLSLLGYVLNFIFKNNYPLTFLGFYLVMILTATWTSVKRPSKSFKGIFGLSFIAIFLSSFLTGAYTLFLTIPQTPWYDVTNAIPLVGMILGNSLTGVSLSLDKFVLDLALRKNQIEDLLSIGASPFEVSKNFMGPAIISGMTPVLNTMMVVGIVSIPGMMTGQILAGASPVEASFYQLVIMLMICASNFISAFLVCYLTFKKFFNSHRFNESVLSEVL